MSGERPKARTDGLLVRDIGDEVIVYELESHRGHCLNRTAALVWRVCDGRKSIAAIARRLGRELGVPPDDDLVRYALRKLARARLLEPETETTALARRQVARRIGELALLPVVISLLAPRPSEATTCAGGGSCPVGAVCTCQAGDNGKTCWNGVNCTSWLCCNGSCTATGC